MVEFFQGVGRASPKRKLGYAEHLIMKPLLLGKTNQEIATERGLEVNTVCAHLKNIYKKLGVHSRNDARSKYLRLYGGGTAVELRQKGSVAWLPPLPFRRGEGLGRGVRIGPWGSAAEEFIGTSSPQPSPPSGEEREKPPRLAGEFLNSTAVCGG
jgi:hypothetical protein